MLSIPPEAFGFVEVPYKRGGRPIEKVAATYNAALAQVTETPD